MPIALLRRTARALAPALALAVLAPGAGAADGPDIARLAPKRSFLAVSIPDFSRLRAAFERSDLGALWAEPGIRAFIEEISKEQTEQFGAFLKETGIKLDDLKPPTGPVGVAMFLRDAEAKAPEPGKRPSAPPPGLLAFADMGENADGTQEALDRLIDRGVKDKKITTEEDTYAGAKITRIKPIVERPAEPDRPDEPDPDAPEFDRPPSGMDALFEGPLAADTQINLARTHSTFLICTDPKALEAALDALDGKAIDSLTDAPEFRDSMDQHPEGQLARVVLLTGALFDLALKDMAAGAPPEAGDSFKGMMEALGVANVKSVSMGLKLDTPDGMAELSSALLVPEKKGLIALFTPGQGPFDPPGFVPPDAADVVRISFRFDGVFDVLRQVAATFPEPMRQQMNLYLDQGVNIIKPALDAAGPTVHSFTTFKRPLAEDSEQGTYAIEVRDSGVIANTLTLLATQGFEARDFEGNTIYATEFMPFALGLGFDRLFIGPEAGIENAMRLAGRADAPRIGAEPAFREAARLIADNAVFAQFSDMRQYVRWLYFSWQHERQAIDDSRLPERRKAELRESLAWVEKLPPIEAILRHLGDTASDLRATPDGFRGRTVLLRPPADAR